MDMLGSRILIVGCSGSGKSTFARKLGALTGTPVIHLDRLLWKPGWLMSDRADFLRRLDEELLKDTWIMDGNYDSTLPSRLARATDVLAFDLPRWFCIYRVLKRVITNYGRTRTDMTENCPERLDLSFLFWIWTFPEKVWKPTTDLLKAHQDRVRIRYFRRPKDAEALLIQEAEKRDGSRRDGFGGNESGDVL